MVFLLQFFGGNLHLDDILYQDIYLLNKLKDAKIRIDSQINQEREKERKKNEKGKNSAPGTLNTM